MLWIGHEGGTASTRRVYHTAMATVRGPRFAEFVAPVEVSGTEIRHQKRSHRRPCRVAIPEFVTVPPITGAKARDDRPRRSPKLVERCGLCREDAATDRAIVILRTAGDGPTAG